MSFSPVSSKPWPVWEALKTFGLKAEEALIVDDLKPGVLMARSTGVQAAGAGWSHKIPVIREFMIENCLTFFEDVEDFSNFILT